MFFEAFWNPVAKKHPEWLQTLLNTTWWCGGKMCLLTINLILLYLCILFLCGGGFAVPRHLQCFANSDMNHSRWVLYPLKQRRLSSDRNAHSFTQQLQWQRGCKDSLVKERSTRKYAWSAKNNMFVHFNNKIMQTKNMTAHRRATIYCPNLRIIQSNISRGQTLGKIKLKRLGCFMIRCCFKVSSFQSTSHCALCQHQVFPF